MLQSSKNASAALCGPFWQHGQLERWLTKLVAVLLLLADASHLKKGLRAVLMSENKPLVFYNEYAGSHFPTSHSEYSAEVKHKKACVHRFEDQEKWQEMFVATERQAIAELNAEDSVRKHNTSVFLLPMSSVAKDAEHLHFGLNAKGNLDCRHYKPISSVQVWHATLAGLCGHLNHVCPLRRDERGNERKSGERGERKKQPNRCRTDTFPPQDSWVIALLQVLHGVQSGKLTELGPYRAPSNGTAG